ncbi:sodium:calcium antiporter [Candidatus Woesearchaeota archaeon]|nr:sodium:calcium antiporter [Candidatus Woesearchaeota archaeon]
MVMQDLAVFIGASVALVIFGSLLVRTILKLAQFLRLSEFVVAFLILAIATSLPELFVGIQSALAGTPEISLGNVIGSNIIDLSLIGGIIILLARGVTITERLVRRDVWMMVLIATIPIILMTVGKGLSQFDGLILLAAYAGYLSWLYFERRGTAVYQDHVKRWEAVFNTLLFVACGFVLYFTAKLIVSSGERLALSLGLPDIFVGLIFVALGTAMPELVFGTRAVLSKHPQLAVGDLVGAVIVNSLLVTGVTALITPITTSLMLFFTSAVFLLFLVILFATMASRKSGFTWEEGIVLILFYVLFLIIELNVQEFLA